MLASLNSTTTFLDEVLALASQGKEREAMDGLISGLYHQRNGDPAGWHSFIEKFRQHGIMELVLLCPFTARSFRKPRGYAGDAVMLDDMYGLCTDFPHPATAAGQIYSRTINAPAPWAVRERRKMLAQLIDETQARTGAGRVLALACGHARELALSSAYDQGLLEEYVAFDQDEQSLEVVRRDYAQSSVHIHHGNVRNVITGKTDLGKFDLIYAAGLFDYLSQPLARRLASRMYSALRPGGVMLIPNFVSEIPDIGYMEACMDWWLIYRDEAQLADVFGELPEEAKSTLRIFRDERGNIVYGQLSRC